MLNSCRKLLSLQEIKIASLDQFLTSVFYFFQHYYSKEFFSESFKSIDIVPQRRIGLSWLIFLTYLVCIVRVLSLYTLSLCAFIYLFFFLDLKVWIYSSTLQADSMRRGSPRAIEVYNSVSTGLCVSIQLGFRPLFLVAAVPLVSTPCKAFFNNTSHFHHVDLQNGCLCREKHPLRDRAWSLVGAVQYSLYPGGFKESLTWSSCKTFAGGGGCLCLKNTL